MPGLAFAAATKSVVEEDLLFAEAQTRDFIEFGFEPEFIGRLPVRVELSFLESGLVGRYRPTEADLAEAREAIEAAARGIRQRRFDPTPGYQTCRYCPYNQICPSTATQE